MNKTYKLLISISIIASLISYFIDFRICLGIVLATVGSLLYIFLLTKGMNDLFDNNKGIFSSFLATILRYLCLLVPMLFAIKYSQYVHFIGVIIGFVLFKIVLIISNL